MKRVIASTLKQKVYASKRRTIDSEITSEQKKIIKESCISALEEFGKKKDLGELTVDKMVVSLVPRKKNLINLKASVSYSTGRQYRSYSSENEDVSTFTFEFSVDDIAPGFLDNMEFCTTPYYELNRYHSFSENSISSFRAQIKQNFEDAMDSLQEAINQYSSKFDVEAHPVLEFKQTEYPVSEIDKLVEQCMPGESYILTMPYNFVINDCTIDGVDFKFDNSDKRIAFTMKYNGTESKTDKVFFGTDSAAYIDSTNNSKKFENEVFGSLKSMYRSLQKSAKLFKDTVELSPLADEIIARVERKYSNVELNYYIDEFHSDNLETIIFEVTVIDDRIDSGKSTARIMVPAGTPVNKAVQKISRAVQRRLKQAEAGNNSSEELI